MKNLKHITLLMLCLTFSLISFAQVGIGTENEDLHQILFRQNPQKAAKEGDNTLVFRALIFFFKTFLCNCTTSQYFYLSIT